MLFCLAKAVMWRFGLYKLQFYIYHPVCLVWITSQFHAVRVKPAFSFYLSEQYQVEIFDYEIFIKKKKKSEPGQAGAWKAANHPTSYSMPGGNSRKMLVRRVGFRTKFVFFLLSWISIPNRNKKLSLAISSEHSHFLGKCSTPSMMGDTEEEALWKYTQVNFFKSFSPLFKKNAIVTELWQEVINMA